MKPFDQLTYQGRARRLRQLAINALTHYDLDVTRVRLIQAYFNAIYRVDTADGTKYVIRVSLPNYRETDEIQAEALWLAALRRDCDQTVLEPLLNRAGDFVTVAEAPGVPEARRCVVFSWVPGLDLCDDLTLPNYEKLSRLMAQFHQHAATFTLPDHLHVKRFDVVFPYDEPVNLLEGEYAQQISAEARASVRYIADCAQIMLDQLLATGEPIHLIHADLHIWNVKVYQERLYAFDFDDMMYGYPTQDIGIALYYIHRRDDFTDLYGAFRRGYESVLPWPERFRAEVETWIAWRCIDLLNWLFVTPDDDRDKWVKRLADTAINQAAILRTFDMAVEPLATI